MKTCNNCKKEQPLTNFHKDIHNKTGHRNECKLCRLNGSRSKFGRIRKIYRKQIGNSKGRNHPAPDYTIDMLIEWCIQQEEYHKMYTLWSQNGFSLNLTPTCDRIKDAKPYTLNNLQLMTWEANKKKGERDRKNGNSTTNQMRRVLQLSTKRNTVIKEYTSVSIAARAVGTCTSNICACCNGKRKTCVGYKWEYR